MATVDYGDYTITTTETPNGQTQQLTWKAGSPGGIVSVNQQALYGKAAAALAANATFLAIASPTNAQTLAQVQRLTRQMDALIRLLVTADLSDISDT